MLEFLAHSFKLDSASWFLLISMSFAVLYIIQSMMDDVITTALSIPAVLVFAVTARALLVQFGVQLTPDKAVDTGIGFGVGIFSFSLLMAFAFWFKRSVISR